MNLLAGFDPGGIGCFGWALVEDRESLPLSAVAHGVADHADAAVRACLDAVVRESRLVAAAIDAPLIWTRGGPRRSDGIVRRAIAARGCRTGTGTVQSLNSLRGACLVQGVLAAVALREAIPSIPLCEAHPKALRWLSEEAKNIEASSAHERDGLIGAIAAWAMVHEPTGWVDLYTMEKTWFSPLPGPLAYWMPIPFEILSKNQVQDGRGGSAVEAKCKKS